MGANAMGGGVRVLCRDLGGAVGELSFEVFQRTRPPTPLLDEDVPIEWWLDFDRDPSRSLRHDIEFRDLQKARGLFSFGCPISRSGKGVDVPTAERLVLERLRVSDEIAAQRLQLLDRPRSSKLVRFHHTRYVLIMFYAYPQPKTRTESSLPVVTPTQNNITRRAQLSQ